METTLTKVNTKAKTPRYLQLASELRAEILADKYGADRPFPTETILCKQYDVSRFTVREALRRLQAEGLISRKRGSGTTIQPAVARGGALHQPLSNVGELLQYARDSKATYAPLGHGKLPKDFADHIGDDTSGEWTSFRGMRHHKGDTAPIAVTDAYFHESLGSAIDQLELESATLFGQIEKLAGISVGKVTQDIQAVAASERVAKSLEIEPGSPVLRILRCYIDTKGKLYEISVSHHPGDRFAYAMHIDVEG